jgi:hypothetical protein
VASATTEMGTIYLIARSSIVAHATTLCLRHFYRTFKGPAKVMRRSAT